MQQKRIEYKWRFVGFGIAEGTFMVYLYRYGFKLIVIFTFVFAMFFFSNDHIIGKKDWNIFEKIIYNISKPVEFIFSASNHFVSSTFHSYISLKHAREEADTFQRENVELKLKIKLLDDLNIENNRLRLLLNLKERISVRFIACEITNADPSFIYKNVRVNVGSKSGVEYGMGVVASGGVVGVVMRVSPYFSDVLLLNDPNSSLDVMVARNRRRGILQGGLANVMRFKYLERGSNILIGDEIVTSGLTGAFPSNISVGRVTNISVESDGVSQIVEVEPTVDFSNLSEAIILLNQNREIDLIKKVGGRDWMKKLLDSNVEK